MLGHACSGHPGCKSSTPAFEHSHRSLPLAVCSRLPRPRPIRPDALVYRLEPVLVLPSVSPVRKRETRIIERVQDACFAREFGDALREWPADCIVDRRRLRERAQGRVWMRQKGGEDVCVLVWREERSVSTSYERVCA